MLRIFQQAFHIPGTLSADLDIRYKAPFDCTLLHVSAVASNDSDATLTIGSSSDDDEFLDTTTIGDSQAPDEFDQDDFVDDQYPRIEDGDTIVITVDYDGSSGTAADDLTVILTFAEG